MKKWLPAAAVFTAALLPQIAFAAEVQGEEHGSWLVLMFFAINFALFAFGLVYFARPMLRQFFTDRAATIRTGLSRAQSALAEAQDLANRAAAKMTELEAEAKALASELDEETAFLAGRIGETAKTAAERIRRDTDLTAAAIGEAAGRRVRERLAGAATDLARNLIARQLRTDDQGRLIGSFMDQLGAESRR